MSSASQALITLVQDGGSKCAGLPWAGAPDVIGMLAEVCGCDVEGGMETKCFSSIVTSQARQQNL